MPRGPSAPGVNSSIWENRVHEYIARIVATIAQIALEFSLRLPAGQTRIRDAPG